MKAVTRIRPHVRAPKWTVAVAVVALAIAGVVVPATSAAAVGNTTFVPCGDDGTTLLEDMTLDNRQVGGTATLELAAGCVYTISTDSTHDIHVNGNAGDAFAVMDDTLGANLVVDGNGATIRRAAGAPRFRFFEVDFNGNLTLNDLTLTGGQGFDGSNGTNAGQGASGGAILTDGSLTLNNVTVTGNTTGNGGSGSNTGAIDGNPGAPSGEGGGIYASESATVSINNSTISNNATGQGGGGGNALGNGGEGGVSGDGGGLASYGALTMTGTTVNGNYTGARGVAGSAADNGPGGFRGNGGGLKLAGSATVTNSLIENNSTGGPQGYGGGIAMPSSSGAPFKITNDTFYNNVAWRAGALYAQSDEVDVSQSTFTGNTANGTGDGITGDVAAMDYGAKMVFSNTLMYSNGSPSTVDCNTAYNGAQVTYQSLGGLMSDSNDFCGTNTVVADPKLGSLADNGGETQTRALLAGSPAINAGVGAYCAATDQRGVARPQGSGCDIGAYEYAATPASGAISGSQSVLSGATDTYVSSVANSALNYQWSVTGVTSTITGNGANSPHITFTSEGTATVKLTLGIAGATDSQATQTLTVNVGPDDDPGPTAAMEFSGATVAEGGTLDFPFDASHADGFSFGYAHAYPDCGAGGALQSKSITATGGSYTCLYTLAGSFTSFVQLVDIYGVTSNIASLPVIVIPVAPTIAISGPATPNEGSTSTYSYTMTEPGNEALTASTSCSGGASKVAGSDTFTGTVNNFAGTFKCTTPNGPATAQANVSSYGASSSYDIAVQNVAPSLALSGPSTVNENGNTPTTYTYSLNATDPSSSDKSALTLVAGSASCGAGLGTVVSASTTAITCRFAGPGTAVISARVADPDWATSTGGSESVQVNNVAPVITFAQPTGSVSEGTSSNYPFSVVDAGLDTLTVTAPTGCTAVTPYTSAPGSVSGVFTCSHPDGPASIDHTMSVSDGTTSVSATITQQVLDVAPSVMASLTATTTAGSPVGMTIGSVVDPGQDTVTQWIVHWGDGQTATFTSPPGFISHVFSADGYIDPTIDLVDEDGTHVNVGSPMEILVYNAAPTLTYDDLPTDVNEGTTSTIHYTITDPDVADTETVSDISCGTSYFNEIINNPVSDIVQNGRTGSFDCTWIDGDSTVTVDAWDHDANGNPSDARATVTIHNVPPTITWDPTDPLTATVGQSQTYHFTAIDPGVDDDLLALSFYPGTASSADGCGAGNTATNYQFDSATRTGYITCQFGQPGIATPTVTVYDDSTWPTFSENVTVSDVAPSVGFSDVEPTELSEGNTVTYTFSGYQQGTSGWKMVGSPDCGVGGSLVSSNIDTGGGPSTFVCQYVDGPSTAAASVTIANAVFPALTASATSSTVQIDNVAPTTSLGGSGQYQPGTPYELTLEAINDPGQDTVSTWTVHWGDGTTDTYHSLTPDPTHTYPTASTHTISLDITDEDGTYEDVAEQTVKTPDNTPPVIALTGPYTVEATGPDGAAVNWVLPTATDDRDGTDPVVCGNGYTDYSGATFPLGRTQLNCRAEDSSGNWDENEYLNIYVVDTTAPTVTPPADVTAEATSSSGAIVSYSGASATDLVDGSVNADCEPASGTTFALGTTTVTCTASDAQLNTAHATFDVTVSDTTAPVLTVPSNFTVGATSAAGADVTYTATATDAVDGSITPDCSPASGALFAREATTTVTCTATDSNSNESTETFDVTVHGTVTSADASAGDMKLELDDGTGFAAGDYAIIDQGGADQEVRYIQHLGSIDFAAPLASNHPAGTMVSIIGAPDNDTVAPTITIADPVTAERIPQGKSVTVTFSCADTGVGVQGCDGTSATGTTLDTSKVGTHTFTVDSWDFNGNASSTTVSYVVVASGAVLGFTGSAIPYWAIGLALLLILAGAFVIRPRRRRRAHRA